MLRRALAAAALVLLAAPAWAGTYYISPTGTATWANAVNSGTPASIYTANTQAVAGDLILAQGGTYPFRIKPRRSGTSGNPIVYAGAAGSPTAAVFPGITFGDSNNSEPALPRGNYITVKWVRINSDITIDSQAISGGGTNIPTGDSLHAIDHTGGATTTIKGRLASYTNSTSTTRQINMFGDGGFFLGPNTIDSLQVDATNASGGDYQFFRLAKVHGLSISNSRFFVSNAAPSSGYSFFLETYGCRNVDFLNNHVVFRDSCAGTTSQFVWGHRDSSQFIRIVGNVIDAGGPIATQFRLSHTGSNDCCNRGIRLERNVIRLRNPTAGQPAIYFNIGSHADTVRFNLFETWGGSTGFETALTVDSLLFAHNTIIHNGQQAVRLGASSTTGTRAVANLAYARTANGTGSTSSVFYAHESMGLDSVGTIFSPGGNSAGGIYRSTSGAGTPGSGGKFGISGKAVWGSPRFMNGAAYDSSQGTAAGVSQTGYALSVKSPSLHDGFSGAFSDSVGGSAGSGDTSPPSTIADLAAPSGYHNAVDLEWTSPDDDGTGTGAAAVYDIRYSTSTITEGNWSSASQFTGEPTPQDFDMLESWTTPAVLSPSTLYYFAMKSRDEVGNESALSNVTSRTTSAPPPSNAITLGALETYPNFNTVGYRLYYSGDANLNSTAVAYLIVGSSSTTDTLYRIHPPDTLRSESMFAGSGFWLAEGATYTLNVVVTDPDGGGSSATSTFTTRAAATTTPSGAIYYVAAWGAGSDSAAGTVGDPFRTMQKAWSVMTPGDGMRLMAGVHRDTLATVAADSGTVALRKYILGEPGAILSGADPAYLVRSDWDSLTAAGQKLYFQRNFPTWPRTVVFGDSMRLFRHKTANSLATDSLGTSGNMEAGWARSKSGDTLYVQLEGGVSPNGYAANIASRTYALKIKSNNVVVDGLAVRFFGTDYRTDYYLNVGVGTGVVYINDAKNVTVRNCHFLNNGWDAVAADSSALPVRDITIEGNIFRDTRVAGWGTYSSNTMQHHPVVFMGSGRGGVVRNNTYRGFKDGGFRVDQLQPAKFADADINYNDMRDWTLDSDAVELDACDCHNVRVWGNQAYAGGNFLDTEIRRGPVYAIYNRGARLAEGVQFRTFYVDSTFGPFHLLHNTLTSTSGGFSGFTGVNAKPVRGVTSINNLIVGPYRAYDDANGKWRTAAWVSNYNVFSGGGNLARVDTVTYGFIDSTAYRTTTGWDKNSRFRASFTFADTANFNLAANSAMPSIDRGRLLRGINIESNLPRYSGTAPDMGALEYEPPVWTPAATTDRHRGHGDLRRRVRPRLR